MGKPRSVKTATRLFIGLSVIAVMTACGGGAGGVDPELQTVSTAPVTTTGNAPAFDPTDPNEFVPTPGNGLNIIASDDPNQDLASDTSFIEAQWLHMQTCLQVNAQEPTVTVVDGKITPVDSNDDVIRHIDGQIVASSHVTDTSASIHVRTDDFDGSLGKPGSYLRSITGRYLWLANSLSERDYPHECAQGE